MLDLGDKIPTIQVKFGTKTYEINASDDNVQTIDKIMELYVDMNNQIDDLQKRLENGEVTPDSYRSFSNNLVEMIRNKVMDILDELLNEKGIGKKLWEAKGESTQYLLETLKQIQSALTAAKQHYSRQKDEEIRKVYKSYPASRTKPIHHKKYKK
jgi:hypothetical protein